ncbi:hemerythrin domain-containing protein [Skermanella stibiiresistens]|nr:hemerythrin domain-containing protein [Skermanella stibiiresistens]
MTDDTGWISMRGLAAVAGGAAAALLASRLLPPLVAQATGSARAAAGTDAFEALIHDHRIILSLLDRMEHSPNSAVLHRTQLFLRLKRRLSAHAMAEEDVIYPLLHDRAHEKSDALHLYGEHAEMKILIHALERTPKDDPGWSGIARDLRILIEGHVHQEEEVEFPKLRHLLDRKEIVRMSGEVQREKALIL